MGYWQAVPGYFCFPMGSQSDLLWVAEEMGHGCCFGRHPVSTGAAPKGYPVAAAVVVVHRTGFGCIGVVVGHIEAGAIKQMISMREFNHI